MRAIDFPFRISGGKLATTESYPRLVRNQIIDSVMTNYQERIMRPEYGSDIQALVFEQADDLRRKDANEIIKERLIQMVPRAIIEDVSLEQDFGSANVVYVKVTFRVNSYSEAEDVTIPVPERAA